MKTKQSLQKRLYASIAGTVAVALCCFTPLLVGLLAVAGLSALTPYLDFVLFPALAVMIGITIYAYYTYRKGTCHANNTCTSCDIKSATSKENQLNDTKDTTNITCPKCNYVQKEPIPQTHCQPFYVCKSCKETISVPKESKNCCVFCEYAEEKCPVPNIK